MHTALKLDDAECHSVNSNTILKENVHFSNCKKQNCVQVNQLVQLYIKCKRTTKQYCSIALIIHI